MRAQQTITCFQCCFFHITYDKNFPYGCREMNFKSKTLPMNKVYENSGVPCLAFSQKKPKDKQS